MPHGATAPSGDGPPHYPRFTITSHSVALLWTSDQPDVEISTWQHTALTRERERDIHAHGGVRTQNPASEQLQTHALDSVGIGIGPINSHGSYKTKPDQKKLYVPMDIISALYSAGSGLKSRPWHRL